MAYDLKTPNVPRLIGRPLRLVNRLAHGPLGGVVWRAMAGNIGMHGFRSSPAGDAPLAPLPVLPAGRDDVTPPDLDALADAPSSLQGEAPETIADFRRAYREGATDPVEVAERVIAAIEASEKLEPKMRFFIAHHADDVMRQAKASKERWARGEPMGPLDGVPVAIKDEVDLAGYPTTQGTSFLGKRGNASADATSAAGLRAAGATLLGKANMTEIGINPIGHQPHHGTTRNPYDTDRFTGASSSGSGAAVAAGICPVALGADGGGSIRNPASFCGVVGLKATFGRVSEHGVPPICWSVGHIGPLAASARDCALGYALMAGPDPHDVNTLRRPAVDLDGVGAEPVDDLSDLTLGVYSAWFDDADEDVVKVCRDLLDAFVARGAKVKAIEVEGLETMRVAHLITIASEMLAAQRANLDEHLGDFAPDVQLLFANIARFRADDYVHAQRHRSLMCQRVGAILDDVDMIVTPTNGCTAPPIRPAALSGESDLTTLSKVMRFVVAGNMTGLPAISFPAGYDRQGLPVGFQAMGRAWEESRLLRLAIAAEDLVERRRPTRHWRLLEH